MVNKVKLLFLIEHHAIKTYERAQVSLVSRLEFCAFLLDGVELPFRVSKQLPTTSIQRLSEAQSRYGSCGEMKNLCRCKELTHIPSCPAVSLVTIPIKLCLLLFIQQSLIFQTSYTKRMDYINKLYLCLRGLNFLFILSVLFSTLQPILKC
jgi:hypothetical protein